VPSTGDALYKNPLGLVYDSGALFRPAFDRAIELAD